VKVASSLHHTNTQPTNYTAIRHVLGFPGQSGYEKKLVISGFLMALVGCWNSSTVASRYMTTSWLAAATQMILKEPNVHPFLPQPSKFTCG